MNGSAFYEEAQGFPPWVYGVLLFAIVVVVSVSTIRMRTTVTAQAVEVRYGFLYSTSVPFSEIVRAEAIAYHPIRDYGGWGIRGFRNRRALNARGDRGVLLIRRDGSTLLVGSQRPRDLLAALRNAGVATEDRLPPDIRSF